MSTPLVRVLIILSALVAAMAVATAVVFSRGDDDAGRATVRTPPITITALPAELSGATAVPGQGIPAPATPNPATTATPGPTLTVRARIPANVRSGPGTNFAVVTTLSPGQELQATARNPDATWLRVSGNGVSGWIAADIVEVDGDARRLSPAGSDSGATPTPTGTARP